MSVETDYQGVHPSRRQFLLGGALLATAAAAIVAAPRAGAPIIGPGGLEKAIPQAIGKWHHTSSSGLVLPPRDETEARTYDQVLTRVYSSGDGPPVMLLIAFGGGQTGMFEIHRPEACYPAQGYKLSDRKSVPLPSTPGENLAATFWTADSDVRTEQLLYWTRIGHYFPESWAESQIATVRSNLLRKLPDGILVRMSTISPDVPASLAELKEFAQAMLHSIGPTGRELLLGQR